MSHVGDDLGARMRSAWAAELAGRPGRFSLSLLGPDGPVAARDADLAHYAASTVKLALLGALLAAPVDLAAPVAVHADFPSRAGGRFALRQVDDQDDQTWAALGTEVPLGRLAERMVVASGNLAAALVAERVGVPAVQAFLAGAGVDGVCFARLIGDTAAEASGITNTVTAAGLSALLSGLTDGRLLPAEATARARDLLTAQQHRRMIPAGLPPGTWWAGKGGWVPGVKHDVALVRPGTAPAYVLAVCTTAELADDDGEQLVARLSRITWEAWTTWHA